MAAAVLVAGFGLASVARAGPPVGDLRPLVSNVLAGLSRLSGAAADPAETMRIGVALNRPDPAGEAAYYRSLYDPASPSYRRFLTPAQFDRRFGVAAASARRVVDWLGSQGLAVDRSSGSRDFVVATGTVRTVQAAFDTTIERFQSAGTTFLANTSPPRVPSGLPVLSVLGLNTFQRFSTPERPSAAKPAEPDPAGPWPAVNLGLTTPQNLWSIYNQPDELRGRGQRVAIFGAGASKGPIADLEMFERRFGLPGVPVTVKNVGPGPFTDTSASFEWALDMQAAVGMAPDLDGVTLYFGRSLLDTDVAATFAAWVADPNGPAQGSASFGACVRSPLDPLLSDLPGLSLGPGQAFGLNLGNNLQPVGDQILRQAAIQGRTLFSASGDTGSSCPLVVLGGLGAGNGVLNQVVPLTLYPASSPFSVAVGGTVLYTTGAGRTRFLEYAWPFTGGGGTLFTPEPAYQRGVPGNFLPCLAGASGDLGLLGRPCRGIPDVAAQSGDALTNGYSIIVGGQPATGGGTSLSSPLWAGMWARVQQSGGAGGYGFANETLYRLGKNDATRARAFTDVTIGVNGVYAALPGWDYVSGFGSPNVTRLIEAVRP